MSALLVHALFDLDWAYPALAGFMGIAVACASAGPSRARLDRPTHVSVTMAATTVCGLMVYPLAAYATVKHTVDRGNTLTITHRYDAAANTLDTDGWPGVPDARPDSFLVQEAANRLQNGGLDPFPDAVMSRALDRTKSMATVDPSVAMARAWVVFGQGRHAAGVKAAGGIVTEVGSYRPDVVATYGIMLAADGQTARAERVLLASVERFARPGYWAPPDVIELAATLRVVAGQNADTTACAWSLVERAFPSSVASMLSSPLSDRPPPATCPAGQKQARG